MLLAPGMKRGYSATLEGALEILERENLLQDHGRYGVDKAFIKIESTPAGLWPVGVPMQPDSKFTAFNQSQFRTMFESFLLLSPAGKVLVMEVEIAKEVEGGQEEVDLRVKGAST